MYSPVDILILPHYKPKNKTHPKHNGNIRKGFWPSHISTYLDYFNKNSNERILALMSINNTHTNQMTNPTKNPYSLLTAMPINVAAT
jgi:hypothetical protein